MDITEKILEHGGEAEAAPVPETKTDLIRRLGGADIH